VSEKVRASKKRVGGQTAGVSSYQALVMPVIVALGGIGLAIFYAFFTTDPNRFLYAGMALLIASTWLFSFWLRLRRMRLRR